MLPISSKDASFTPFRHTLFTATSATCVTGLVIFDTFQKWTYFGQVVILLLIQIGGLGLVTLITFFNFVLGRKLGLRTMQLASESVSADSFNDIKRFIKNVIKVSLVIESLGALVLMTVFVPKFGFKGIYTSIFIAVSSFCNAGFDVLGQNTPFASVTEYNSNPVVLITIMLLIVFGGLGFLVWNDLIYYKKTKHLELHTKIVLIITAILIFSGAALFLISEWNNTKTFAPMTFGDKILNSLFQSITCRTAGFNSVDINSLYPVSKVISIILMYIGAAPGSTGGGIKVTTFVVIIMTVVSVLKNKEDTTILKRRIDKSTVYKSISIVMLSLMTIFLSTVSIYFSLNKFTKVSGLDSLFEVVSAFATVGLSAGVSSVVNLFSELILTFMMFLGRVGPISLVLFLLINNENKSKNKIVPEGKIMVG